MRREIIDIDETRHLGIVIAKDGRFDLAGFKNVLRLRAEYEGVAPAAPEKYLDLSYYRRALNGL